MKTKGAAPSGQPQNLPLTNVRVDFLRFFCKNNPVWHYMTG